MKDPDRKWTGLRKPRLHCIIAETHAERKRRLKREAILKAMKRRKTSV